VALVFAKGTTYEPGTNFIAGKLPGRLLSVDELLLHLLLRMLLPAVLLAGR